MPEPEQSNPSNGDWMTPVRFAALLAVLVFVAYPQVFLGLQTFVYRDFGYFSYPIAQYLQESFRQGEIPLWNPLNDCGTPFLAQWNTQTLYPPSLFYLVFPLSWSLAVFCLLHLYLGGLGMFYLSRHWTGSGFGAAFAGIIFAFSGLMLNCLMWPATIPGFGWMPWVVWLTERAWREGGSKVITAALVGALQMLSGAVEVVLVTWMLLGAMYLLDFVNSGQRRWRTLLRTGLVVALISGLCAAQILPFLDLLAHSNRQTGFDSTAWPMPIMGWVNLFAPLFRTHRVFHGVFVQAGQDWTNSYYVGAFTVVLATWAVWRMRDQRTWLLAALTLFCLILALGDATPVYSWVRNFSVIGWMRYPVKFVSLPIMLLPLLAAFALAEWQRRIPLQKNSFDHAWWSICAAMILLLLTFAAISYTFEQFGNDDRKAAVLNTLARTAYFVALVAGLFGLRTRIGVNRSGLVMCVMLVVAWLDVSRHMPQPFTVNRSIYDTDLPRSLPQPRFGVSRAMVSHEALFELNNSFIPDVHEDYLSRRYALFRNCNLLEDIAKVDGFFPLQIREQKNIYEQFYTTNALDPPPAPLLDFLGVSQLTRYGKIYEWMPRSTFMPMITGGQKPVFADERTTLNMLLKTDFNPRAEVYLPPEARTSIIVTGATTVSISTPRYSAKRVEIEAVHATAPALLVVAQTFYHPWRAYVDNKPVPLLRANEAFQAVQVPEGTHQIVLKYEDRMFQLGGVVSLVTLLGSAGVLVIARRKRIRL